MITDEKNDENQIDTDNQAQPLAGTIIVAVEDMFFAAKILGAAHNVGRTIERVKSADQLLKSVATDPPALVILDLNSKQFEAMPILAAFKSSATLAAIPILGFLSHVQLDLKRRVEEAGCDFVMTRSAFSQNLPAILSGTLPEKAAQKP